jgi:phosphatidate phosphatase PAH1
MWLHLTTNLFCETKLRKIDKDVKVVLTENSITSKKKKTGDFLIKTVVICTTKNMLLKTIIHKKPNNSCKFIK